MQHLKLIYLKLFIHFVLLVFSDMTQSQERWAVSKCTGSSRYTLVYIYNVVVGDMWQAVMFLWVAAGIYTDCNLGAVVRLNVLL